MKKLLCIMFVFMIAHVIANDKMPFQDWLNCWTSGVFAVKHGDYEQAIVEYSQAIALLEKEGQLLDHLYIYNSRGQAYLFADYYQEALADFKKVVETKQAELTDKITAQWGITRCYAHLEDLENFSQEFTKLKEMDPHYPKVESNKEYLIYRNFHSDSPCVKKHFAKALVQTNICDKIEDVVFTNTGICIVRKKGCCGCNNKENQEVNLLAKNDEEKCKYWCDRVANAALVLCGKKFKTAKCQWLCVEVVEALKDGCYWCCEGEGFYKRCVKPFEDVISQVPCDPMWD